MARRRRRLTPPRDEVLLGVDDAPTGLALATDAHLYVTTAGGRLLRVPVRRGVRPAEVV